MFSAHYDGIVHYDCIVVARIGTTFEGVHCVDLWLPGLAVEEWQGKWIGLFFWCLWAAAIVMHRLGCPFSSDGSELMVFVGGGARRRRRPPQRETERAQDSGAEGREREGESMLIFRMLGFYLGLGFL
ncbi:hypothetical protein O6H91_01G005100 [Diphasiastrum complanatum]|uniref:Uncharacterized protein n=1 Tax=Diphasiastrum complanatum TaxID=34168 RepID=A0ACC2EMM6_DIPCM|nr:hypothetical protein O6H91_01G005100 [Diphasiastrum complanatum]